MAAAAVAGGESINDQSERQSSQTKELAQNVAHSLMTSLTYARDSLVLWAGFIAIVALASAGLWVGIAGVGLIFVWVWRRNLRTAKALYRFERFRNDCFRKLLEVAEGKYGEKMLQEDKEFVLMCRDSILYPLAVVPERRISPSDDLGPIEVLYREYCTIHTDGPYPKECDLCAARRRVTEHVEGVLSKFEAAIESARQTLVSQIDGPSPQGVISTKDFLEKFRSWADYAGSSISEDSLQHARVSLDDLINLESLVIRTTGHSSRQTSARA